MKCIIALVLLTGYINYTIASCTIGPGGINQWRLIEQIGNCLNADECLVGTEITQADCPYIISAPGLYTVCENITIASASPVISITASDVTLNLNGHLAYNTGAGTAITCNATNVTIRDGSAGTNSDNTILITGSTQVNVFDIDITNAGFYGIRIVDSVDVLVERYNCTSAEVPMIGILDASDGVKLRSCVGTNAEANAVFIDISPATAYGISFEDCHFGSLTGFAAGFQVDAAGGVPISFKNCSATNFEDGFWLMDVNDVQLDSCYVYNVDGWGFHLDSCNGASMQNCEASQVGDTAYFWENCSNLTVNNCRAKSDGAATGPGFLINGTAPTKIVLSDCSSFGFTNGFSVTNLSSAAFTACIAENSTAEGFITENSFGIVLRDCSTIASGSVGFFFGTTTDLIAENCIAENNLTLGFRIDGGTSNITLSRCSALGNSTGFSISAGVAAFITLEQCLASGNNRGILNSNGAANTVFLMDTRSEEVGIYRLNTLADMVGGAVIVTY